MHGSIHKAMDNTNEQPPFQLLRRVLNLFTRKNAHLQHFKKHFFLKRAKSFTRTNILTTLLPQETGAVETFEAKISI